MSITIIDNSKGENTVKVTINTNIGYVVFWTNTGSAFEARTRLKNQESRISWADVYHARVEVGA